MEKNIVIACVSLVLSGLMAGCGGSVMSPTPTPGAEKQLFTRVLEGGAAMMQAKPPLDALNMYLDGFHFYADDLGHQMGARHYCAQMSEEFIQCVIYDANTKDAKLMGIEYIVSERLFSSLSEEEKRLWHSHHYEVTSGALVIPGVPGPAEHAVMEQLVTTYGKTWHTWDTAKSQLPVGIPGLMMGFTADGQLRPELRKERDEQLGISAEEKRESRRDIPVPRVVPGANGWESGRTYQLRLEGRPVRGVEGRE